MIPVPLAVFHGCGTGCLITLLCFSVPLIKEKGQTKLLFSLFSQDAEASPCAMVWTPHVNRSCPADFALFISAEKVNISLNRFPTSLLSPYILISFYPSSLGKRQGEGVPQGRSFMWL